jgi:hypothetical protein
MNNFFILGDIYIVGICMKGCNALVFVVGAMLLIGIFAPLAVGENDSLCVVLTAEDKVYRAENTVTVAVNVFDMGVLADVSEPANQNITLTVRRYGVQGNPTEPLTVTKQTTGVYTATFIITTEYRLQFECEVRSGPDVAEDSFELSITESGFSIDVNFDGQGFITAKSGDVVTATIETRFGSTLVDVDGFDILKIEDGVGNEMNLTETHVGTGIYSVTYTMPTSLDSVEYSIIASPVDVWQQAEAVIFLNVLDVWYHKLSSAGQTVTFEVCVADLTGVPVNGAAVVIQRGEDVQAGTTNETGKTLFSLTNVNEAVGITGYVLYGGNNQTISGSVFNPQPSNPGHHLDIIWQGTNYYLGLNENSEQAYTAYYDQLPLSNQQIFYYVSAGGADYFYSNSQGDHVDTPFEVVASGAVSTDATGAFTIEFESPDTQSVLNAVFEVPLDSSNFQNQDYDQNDGKYYDVWPEYSGESGSRFFALDGNLYDDSSVNIDSEKFKPGKPATITVNIPSDYDDDVVMFWGIGTFDLTTGENYEPSWASWVPGGYSVALHKSEGDEYTGSFTVPIFIDSEDVVTVIAGYMDGTTGFPHFNTILVVKGGGIPALAILGIVVVILVILFLIFILKGR